MHGIPGQTVLLLHHLPTRVTTTSITPSTLVVPNLVSNQRARKTLGLTHPLPLRRFHPHPIGAITLSTVHLPLAV